MTLACPNIRETVTTSVPLAISTDAAVCRNACGFTCGRPWRVLKSLIHRVHVCGFVGLPSSCVKIYPYSCQRSPFFIREGQYMPDLSEIYYGSRNYYKGTGRTAYRQTGASSPERELLRKERFERRYKAANKRLSRDGKIALLVKYLDYSQSLAEWMVDADPERDYSSLLELERVK